MEISPGKGHILQSIPAASTIPGLLPAGFAVLCLLTHPERPRYTVPVRRYGPLQSRCLQCRGRPLPPCALLTGFDNSPARDLHPLDIQRTMLPCGSVLGPCRAHTNRPRGCGACQVAVCLYGSEIPQVVLEVEEILLYLLPLEQCIDARLVLGDVPVIHVAHLGDGAVELAGPEQMVE